MLYAVWCDSKNACPAQGHDDCPRTPLQQGARGGFRRSFSRQFRRLGFVRCQHVHKGEQLILAGPGGGGVQNGRDTSRSRHSAGRCHGVQRVFQLAEHHSSVFYQGARLLDIVRTDSSAFAPEATRMTVFTCAVIHADQGYARHGISIEMTTRSQYPPHENRPARHRPNVSAPEPGHKGHLRPQTRRGDRLIGSFASCRH